MTKRSTDHSRRSFLTQTTPAAISGAYAANQMLAQPAAAASDPSTLKIALIGCGARGTGAVAQALSTEGSVKLWAMADAFEKNLQNSLSGLLRGLKKRYDRAGSESLGDKVEVPAERQFAGLDAFKRAIDSGVDVVIITGPPGFRPEHFDYAIQAGKHVFMEKPLATDGTGVKQVLQTARLAKEKNLKVGVGLQRHHQAGYQEAIRRIHDGEIGDVVNLRCFWNSGPPAKTPFSRDKSSTELQHQVRNWYFFDWLSGDHICEQHIHNLDICNWVKQDHPISAEGMGGRQVRTGSEYGNIFDHHAVVYTYPDGTTMHSYCRQMRGCKNVVAEMAEGTNGRAMLGTTRCSLQRNGDPFWESDRGGKTPYQVEHDVLFDAIRNNKPHNEAEQGALSSMTAILGRLATYSGKTVTWEQALNFEFPIDAPLTAWDSKAPVAPRKDGSYEIAVPGVTKFS